MPSSINRCAISDTISLFIMSESKNAFKSNVSASSKREFEPPSSHRRSSCKFSETRKIEAKFRGKAEFFSGTIHKIFEDEFGCYYDILYDDGEFEEWVSEDLIRPQHFPSPLFYSGLSASASGSGSGSGSGSSRSGTFTKDSASKRDLRRNISSKR